MGCCFSKVCDDKSQDIGKTLHFIHKYSVRHNQQIDMQLGMLVTHGANMHMDRAFVKFPCISSSNKLRFLHITPQ